MVGVLIGIEEDVVDRMVGVVKDGGANRLACCLAGMPDKQAAALIVIESLGQTTSCLERVLDTGLVLEACKRSDSGAPLAYEKSSSCRARWRYNRSSEC